MLPHDRAARLVSFIVPALNAEVTLARCLDAILAADRAGADREIVVVDNGSTDRTRAIAEARGARVLSAPGLKVGALRNRGACASRGGLLAFVDADCVIAPDWVAHALRNFRDPDVGGAGAPTEVPAGSTWVETTWALHRHRKNRRRDVQWLPTENLMLRRTAFEHVGGFNERLTSCEDADLCYRLAPRYRLLNDPAMRSIHLGEAKTLWVFFRKEAWRGRGNFAALLSHRFMLSEVPSVILPVYHAVGAVALASALGYSMLARAWAPAALIGGRLAMPSALPAIGTAVRARRPLAFPKLLALYFTYSAARTVAIVAGILPSHIGARPEIRPLPAPEDVGR